MSLSVLPNATTETDDSGESGSGVFRRLMARDLYELTKRVEELERRTRGPLSGLFGSWLHVALILILLMLLAGSIVYFNQRVASLESLQSRRALAQQSELESRQRSIDELRQALRQQAPSQRAITPLATLAGKDSETAGVAVERGTAAPKSMPGPPARPPLPALLKPGEVLLIVASTLTREEAIDQALELERDGHASEVVLGMTGYYGVALGRFSLERAQARKALLVESGALNTVPYLMADESIDSFVYP